MEIGGIYYKLKIMKHILNNLSEEEKNAIREQHTGGMKIELGKFKQMVETKLGDPKPYLNETQIEEQLIKSRDPKIDADANKYWQQLKSKLMTMGFKLTFSKDDSEASPNPLKLIYDKVGKREIVTLDKNGYKVDVQWPGGAIDAGIIEPKEVMIDVQTDGAKPDFSMLVKKIKELVQSGPGLGKGDFEGGEFFVEPEFVRMSVNFQPENISKMISQFIPLLK